VEAEAVREQRVVTPDGHVWHVRRRTAKRRPPWKRQPSYELSPVERDALPILPDADEGIESFGRLVDWDAEFALYVVVGIAVLAVVAIGVLVGLTRAWLLPLLAGNVSVVVAVPAVVVAVLLLDRLTRPWFIEAESARLVDAPRRVWRVQGWWRAGCAFRAVAAAIADGRIGAEHGVVIFSDRSRAP
jgi:hypothetical protein